ncbi:Na+/melibiose symporter-like transporter [Desulfohalotomaculum tongense]|uniref:hypothetical protein n=1 Tax=Desulforadius tongensis TaxID=1216062 RepID=UPI001956E45B|nr:hypothetical protein [Desulforadius tongensis]MBM7854091.1 Na+/melibiose symporter-like transporter [Desulforadius tongensis]
MSDLLNKISVVVAGIGAVWFTFFSVNQPGSPFYHHILLFLVSWGLFYTFIDISFGPVAAEQTNNEKKKKKKKIRRKNKTATQL